MQHNKATKKRAPLQVPPPELTERQKEILANNLWIEEKWFGWIFEHNGRLVENPVILVENRHLRDFSKLIFRTAKVFARDAVITSKDGVQTNSIYCFFIYFQGHVWKASNTKDAAELIEALKTREVRKEFEYNEEVKKEKIAQRRKRARAAAKKGAGTK